MTKSASTEVCLLLQCSEDDDWTPGYPEAVLVHHFAGSWKKDDQQPQAALQAAVQGPVLEKGPLYRCARRSRNTALLAELMLHRKLREQSY